MTRRRSAASTCVPAAPARRAALRRRCSRRRRWRERLGLPVERIVKLDANENPYGPSPKALEALAELPLATTSTPTRSSAACARPSARYVGYGPEWIIAGAGSDELIELLRAPLRAAGRGDPQLPADLRHVHLPRRRAGRSASINVHAPRRLLARPRRGARSGAATRSLIFAVSPNNPTGTPLTRDGARRAARAPACPSSSTRRTRSSPARATSASCASTPNLIVLRTLSKWAGLAGLRVGYMIADPALIDVAMRVKQPYNVNVAAEVAAAGQLRGPAAAAGAHRGASCAERERLGSAARGAARLRGDAVARELRPLPSQRRRGASSVHARLRERGIMVRYFDTPLLQNHLRISVGRPEQTDALVAALREIVASQTKSEDRVAIERTCIVANGQLARVLGRSADASLPDCPSREVRHDARVGTYNRETKETTVTSPGTSMAPAGRRLDRHRHARPPRRPDRPPRHIRHNAARDRRPPHRHAPHGRGRGHRPRPRPRSTRSATPRGIVRMGDALVPLDEALAQVALDLSGRGYAVLDVSWSGQRVGELPCDLIEHFLPVDGARGAVQPARARPRRRQRPPQGGVR